MQRLKSSVEGVTHNLRPNEAEKACSTCLHSKMIRAQAKESTPRATKRLQRLYADIWGAVSVPHGESSILLPLRTNSLDIPIVLNEKKTNIYDIFESWKTKAEKETGKELEVIRADNSGEYKNLARLWGPEGVGFEITTTYTPDQNGVFGRLNRTTTEATRSMLFDAQLPHEFWGEAAKTACYLKNHLPLGDDHGGRTPYELYKALR